jgi:hypothetical protein
MDALPPSEKHLLEVWVALEGWLSQSKSGRRVLADFQVDPRAGARDLASWLQSHSAQAPPSVATHISGGRVDKVITIAQAGVVQILAPAQPSPATGLLHDVFVEYLGLPSLFEIQAKVQRAHARRRGRYSEHERVRSLWQGLSGPMDQAPDYDPEYPRLPAEVYTYGSVVTLHNVQLCSFVNRAPGSRIIASWAGPPLRRIKVVDESRRISALDGRINMLVGPVIRAEIQLLNEFSLGDVRFGMVGDNYLLNAIDAPSEGFSEAVIDTISRLGSGGRGTPKEIWFSTLLRELREKAFEERIFPMTEYGFPVLLTSQVYQDIADIVEGYGAVFAEEVTGFLGQIPAEVQLSLNPGVPKIALYVNDRAMIKGRKRPMPAMASAWTVAGNKQENEYPYAYWPFIIGMDGYQDSLRQATSIIGEALSEGGFEAIFEFDQRTNWFSDQTPFGADNMIEMYRSVQIRSGIPDEQNP